MLKMIKGLRKEEYECRAFHTTQTLKSMCTFVVGAYFLY